MHFSVRGVEPDILRALRLGAGHATMTAMIPFPLIASFTAALAAAAPSPAPAAKAQTLLAVFAHPDDETLVGPLLAAYARRGAKVHLVVVTDGEKGTQPHAGIPAGPELAKARAEEVRCSARALGIEPPVLLGFKDGELGRMAGPPWKPLAEVATEVGKRLAEIRPDAVVTFGPEGAYGHPDHRLVGAVVTQLVQAAVDGAPARLFYPGFPADRMPKRAEGGIPWSPTDPRFLTVRVPYEAADGAAGRAALACHKSQFRPDEIEPLSQFMDAVLGGRVYLRPWFAAAAGEDLFR
jgi:LmbE family N-acetylglucosaminyl deacetylase